jgi:pimeloyl-ACP methyl ester carboxylesterase
MMMTHRPLESTRGERVGFQALFLCAALSATGCVKVVPLPSFAEPQRATTDDGWGIALVRYRPQGPPSGLPVVMVHGISANARNLDLDDEHSMARWFAAHGREAWTVSLRGAGDSDGPDASTGRAGFNFDDYWKHDLPAVIAWVLRVSGAPAVDYVGHSMGGLVIYAYLSQGGQGVHDVATLGSPTRFQWGTGMEELLTRGVARFFSVDWMVPSATGAGLAAPFEAMGDGSPLQTLFYNPESTDPKTWQRLAAYGAADVSTGVARQLLSLMSDGRFLSADGRTDFHRDMAKISTPVLVVAAKLDRIALAPAVKDGYRALGGPKEWLLITRANGARGEYGHMDLVIGDRAGAEVWTPVLDFFARH